MRSCDILRAFSHLCPHVPIIIISALPERFLRNRLPGISFQFIQKSFDIGMVQLDSVRVDIPQTCERAYSLYVNSEPLIAGEREFLRRENAGLVVSDIPAVPLYAAARLGIPSLGVGNFGWDWIYGEYESQDPRWTRIIQHFQMGYAMADLLLRLPFSEPMRAFPNRLDIPIVASPGQNRRAFISNLTGANTNTIWVLLSFTSLEWDQTALKRAESFTHLSFFTVHPLEWPGLRNFYVVDRDQISYSDMLASADAVLTKPGFGAVSDVIVNQKPIVYAERSDFREYPLLVQGIQRFTRHCFLPAAALYSGDVETAILQAIHAAPPAEHAKSGGANIAAETLASYL